MWYKAIILLYAIQDVDLEFSSVSRWGRKRKFRVKLGIWGYGGNSYGPIVPEHQINQNSFEIENDNGPQYKIINKDQKQEE